MSEARLNSKYVETVSKHAVACSEFNEGTEPRTAQNDCCCSVDMHREDLAAAARFLFATLWSDWIVERSIVEW